MLPQLILLRLLSEIINLELQKSNYFQKKIRGISPATVYRHYDKLRNKVTSLRKKEKGAKTVITSEMKDAINN